MIVRSWWIASLLCLFGTLQAWGAETPPLVAVTPEQAAKDPDFALLGEYTTPAGVPPVRALQVVAQGNGTFRVVLYNGGLPGAGWDRQPPQVLEEEDADSVRDMIAARKMTKQSRQSPTLGAAPPPGGTLLLNGEDESLKQHWKPGTRLDAEGLLIPPATTSQDYQDFTLHLEFRLPYMPLARGQARANSGVYCQGRYEAQILDSFGLAGRNNECGGIYEVRDPDLNMCLPPLVWQTYDIDFTAPRFDEKGAKTSNARMTVRLNGVVVQPDVEVPHVTRAAPVSESSAPGPLYLQDHGNPVRYRNIWIVPRDAEREARRPRIPGFERFLASTPERSAAGELLREELGCAHCHSSLQMPDAPVRQAPILTNVGKRAQAQWVLDFISDPHATKPGATMPALFAGWEDKAKDEAALALANFLTAGQQPPMRAPDRQAIRRGEKLYHAVGCIACHAPRDGRSAPEATSVPLPQLHRKYTPASLTEFLLNPHAVRPSGRMPGLLLTPREAEDIACYLLAPLLDSLTPNVNYAVYEGEWQKMPDFDQLKPVATGRCVGFDVGIPRRRDWYGIRFEGFLNIFQTEHYTFSLNSDDGSILYIDGQEVVNHDGDKPGTIKNEVLLKAGVHAVRLDYFEMWGDESLVAEMSIPPWIPPQDLSAMITPHADGSPVAEGANSTALPGTQPFRRDEALVERGRELFASLGCANCHEFVEKEKRVMPRVADVPLKEGLSLRGCLADSPQSRPDHPLPDFELSPMQKHAVAMTGTMPDSSQAVHQVIESTLLRYNCVACHERSGIGGPETARLDFFQTLQQEMGDEGRLPPPLNGVGDKLQESWLKEVLQKGSNERPYMLTRMPKFGENHLLPLADALVSVDQRNEAAIAEFDEPPHRVKAAGRELVGNSALGCIKCHTFRNLQASGIQAISLTSMTQRLREDWFLRYLIDPVRYRPGTRMPTGFPDGKAVIKDIYDGDPQRQVSAIWLYLSDGNKAGLPEGLVARMVELKPEDRPIIYRGFLDGLTPRGIAVGYPEKANLAWDAGNFSLRLIWHDRFLDASKHWVGRGDGEQVPLGDHILSFESTVPFAQLSSPEAPWPAKPPREVPGFHFRGWTLNKAGQPEFRYEAPFGEVTDFPEPVRRNDREGTFRRQLTITSPEQPSDLYFRAATGKTIVRTSDGWRVDDALTIRINGGGEPILRRSGGKEELLVPCPLPESGRLELTQEIMW